MDVGGALEELYCVITVEGNPQPIQVEYCCEARQGGVYNRLVGDRVNMVHHCPSTQGWMQIPCNFPGGGALECHHHNH